MTRTLHCTTSALAALGLAGFLACGGGGGGSTPAPTTASSLSYTDPAGGTYTLVKDTATSTPTHLVLNLMGPGATLSGVGFTLNADTTKVTWAAVTGTAKVASTAFTTPVVAAKVAGDELQGGVYQKGAGIPAVVSDPTTVLATVALDLKTGVPINSAVALSAVSGKCAILEAPGGTSITTPITITFGDLVAR